MTDEIVQPVAPQAAWAGFGMGERLAAAGAIAVFVGWLLGIAIERWDLGVEGLSYLVASALVLVVLFAGAMTSRVLPRTYTLRTAATVIAAFSVIELALAITDFDSWSALTILFELVFLAGAVVLMWGAWQATGGNLMSDIRSVTKLMGWSLADRLIVGGTLLALAGWFLVALVAQIYNFVDFVQISVLALALILAVSWSARDAMAGMRWPLPASYVVAGLAAIAALFALLWLSRVAEKTFEIGGLDVFLPLIVYVAGLVALVAGAVLSVMPRGNAPAA
jgi:hypothetical protein